MTTVAQKKKPYFGLTGGWLTFWITVWLEVSVVFDRNQFDLFCLRWHAQPIWPCSVTTKESSVSALETMQSWINLWFQYMRRCDHTGFSWSPRSGRAYEDNDAIHGDGDIWYWLFLRSACRIHYWWASGPEESYPAGDYDHGSGRYSSGEFVQSGADVRWPDRLRVSLLFKPLYYLLTSLIALETVNKNTRRNWDTIF